MCPRSLAPTWRSDRSPWTRLALFGSLLVAMPPPASRPGQPCTAAALLCALLLVSQAIPSRCADLGSVVGSLVDTVKSAFGGAGDHGGGGDSGSSSYGPIVIKTASAFQYAAAPPGSSLAGPQAGGPLQLPLGSGASVTVHRTAPHSVVLALHVRPGGGGGGGCWLHRRQAHTGSRAADAGVLLRLPVGVGCPG